MTHTSSLPRFDLANHPPSETIKMMTGLLERITKTNDKLQANSTVAAGKRSAYTCFHARSIPSIDIYSYLNRILKYCPCTNECFLSLLVYFDRMSRNSTGLRIDSFNVHRLVISGIMVASKFFSDIFFTNARYAKVGGLPVAELNVLELEFLYLNDFNLHVPVEELQQYGDQLLLHWVREEERRRELQLWRRGSARSGEIISMIVPSQSLASQRRTSGDSLGNKSPGPTIGTKGDKHRQQRLPSSLISKEIDSLKVPSRQAKHVYEPFSDHHHHNYHKTYHKTLEINSSRSSRAVVSRQETASRVQDQYQQRQQRHSWHTDYRLSTPTCGLIHP